MSPLHDIGWWVLEDWLPQDWETVELLIEVNGDHDDEDENDQDDDGSDGEVFVD